jgi:energy-coupling factor transporter ATP-binding protein EcfA2
VSASNRQAQVAHVREVADRSRQHLGITLNANQADAEAQIMASIEDRTSHCLTGFAGSGKTTLVQVIAANLSSRGRDIVLTAPTHKAVAVLKRKLRAAGIISVDCVTIHSLLGLKPKVYGDRLIFEPGPRTPPVRADIVVIDEASMIDGDLLGHIRRGLPNSAALFVGDPAQLPPVGESASPAFETKRKSHLDTIVRQDAANPILDAADCLRRQQGHPLDWSWVRPAMAKPLGVYLPGDRADAWMCKAFTSADFAADTDQFRYLCWTNDRVAEVNSKVRGWIYGDNIPTPFMPGERALSRAPLIEADTTILNTNDEVTVRDCAPANLEVAVPQCEAIPPWSAVVPTWRMSVRTDEGLDLVVHMIRDEAAYHRAVKRIKDEAFEDRERWKDFQMFKSRFARMQGIYASTVHSAQGSTHGHIFLDMPEMRRWARADCLEAQRAMYVAMTRPTHAAILVGAR